MAVAVKNVPETRTSSAFDRLALASLVGVVYLLGSLWVVFGGVPSLWLQAGFGVDTFLKVAALGLVMAVAFVALAFVGIKLASSRPRPGLRAGIFTALMLLLLLLLVCRWLGGFLEERVYNNDWFAGSETRWGGLIAGAIGLLLFFWVLRIFFRRSFEERMVRFEAQGWFSARAYKPGQGQRVRRGTILGILLLGGTGVWVLVNHSAVGSASTAWDVNVPFTGMVIVNDRGNANPKDLEEAATGQLRVLNPGDTDLKDGSTIDRAAARAAIDPLAEKKLKGLKELLAWLGQREETLRRSLKVIPASEPGARNAAEEEASILKGWIERLKPLEQRLQTAEETRNDEALYLVQREIDQAVKREQESEKDRKRTDQAAEKRGSLNLELRRIVSWAEKNRLPVVAPVLSRFRVRDLDRALDPQVNHIVNDPTPFESLPDKSYRFPKGKIISSDDLEGAVLDLNKQMSGQGDDAESRRRAVIAMREAAPATKPVEGKTVYASIVILPAVKYTLPLLLLALTLWLAWRIVNLPTFADFLIATEAEMNKVSWTTRSRLYQDTIVVLTTMMLMAGFLFAVDIAWAQLLSWKPIGVLKKAESKGTDDEDKNLKW